MPGHFHGDQIPFRHVGNDILERIIFHFLIRQEFSGKDIVRVPVLQCLWHLKVTKEIIHDKLPVKLQVMEIQLDMVGFQ